MEPLTIVNFVLSLTALGASIMGVPRHLQSPQGRRQLAGSGAGCHTAARPTGPGCPSDRQPCPS